MSDSNSSNSNLVSEEVSGHSSSGERSMTSFEETPKPKKLSSKLKKYFWGIKMVDSRKNVILVENDNFEKHRFETKSKFLKLTKIHFLSKWWFFQIKYVIFGVQKDNFDLKLQFNY